MEHMAKKAVLDHLMAIARDVLGKLMLNLFYKPQDRKAHNLKAVETHQ
jgi:hypothetical protein